ncbi:hypothetical protein SDJN03_18164, partial [Cucurbita argyrosperma subsp. sororia]
MQGRSIRKGIEGETETEPNREDSETQGLRVWRAEGLRAVVRTSGKEEAAGEREDGEDGATAKQIRERRPATARRTVAVRAE